jgi:hypothetical protein
LARFDSKRAEVEELENTVMATVLIGGGRFGGGFSGH